MENENLILIGRIKEYFQNGTTDYVNAKYVILSEDNITYKLLLHLEQYPYEYHAQAVISYMREKNLDSIYCFGGGRMCIDKTEIICNGKSHAFGTPNDEKIIEVMSNIWPNLILNIQISQDRLEEAKHFTIEQVKYRANNT